MTVTPIGPRSLGVTLSAPASSFNGAARALGLPLADWSAPKAFTFNRCKRDGVWVCGVGLQVGSLWLNLADVVLQQLGRPARNIAEARAWAIDFANAHGFEAREQRNTPRPRPRPRLTVVRGSGERG